MKNMKKRMRVMGKALRMELREHKSSFIVYMTLRALVILVMILQILNRNFENVFLCALTLVLLIMPSLIQINLKIELLRPWRSLCCCLSSRRKSWRDPGVL